MSSIVVAGDVSGSVTIAAPSAAGSTTLTLPSTSGTFVTDSATQTLTNKTLTSPTITGTPTFNGVNVSPYTMKNRIINGAFNVWQRGTSLSASGSGYYHTDRWQNFGQTYTASRSTDVPTGLAQYSLNISGGAGSYGTICQRIEAANCADLVGQSVTVSVYVKAVSGGTNGLTCVLDYATATDNFASQTNIGSATLASTVSGSWTKYTTTFSSLPSGAANGLQLMFYNSSVAANQYRYALVQLEVGSSATQFEWRPYGTELDLCKRYYQTYSDYDGVGVGKDTTAAFFSYPLRPSMRTVPTATFTCTNVDRFGTAYVATSAAAVLDARENQATTYANAVMSGRGEPCGPAGSLLTVKAEL